VSDRLAQWFRVLCRFGVPLLLAILLASVFMDRLHRWPVAASALNHYPGQTAILVGARYKFVGDNWTRSATYVLLPSLRSIEIAASNTAPTRVNESSYGVFGVITIAFWLVLAVGLCAWSWLRTRGTATPNNRWRGP
jgi:hypothetical protein